MNVSPQAYLFICMALVMVSAFVVGIFLTAKDRKGMQSNEPLKEVLIWGGGFVIYAIIDYLMFMH